MSVLLQGAVWLCLLCITTSCACFKKRTFAELDFQTRVLETERKQYIQIPGATHTYTLHALPCQADTVFERILEAGLRDPRILIRQDSHTVYITAACPPADTFITYRPVEVVTTTTTTKIKREVPGWVWYAGTAMGVALLLLGIPFLLRQVR